MNTQGSLVSASLYHAAQSFFVVLNEGISGPQQSWLLGVCNIALALILVVLYSLALRRGPLQQPAGMDDIQLVKPLAGAE